MGYLSELNALWGTDDLLAGDLEFEASRSDVAAPSTSAFRLDGLRESDVSNSSYEPNSGDGTADKSTNCSASSGEDDDFGSLMDFYFPVNKFLGDKYEDEEEFWSRWITVYGFHSQEVDIVLCRLKSFGEILKHVRVLDNANWMHILYKEQCDAQQAIRSGWIQVSGNLMVGLKPLSATERQTLIKEGHNYKQVEADFSKTTPCDCPNCRTPCALLWAQVPGTPGENLNPCHLPCIQNSATTCPKDAVDAENEMDHYALEVDKCCVLPMKRKFMV